METQPMKSKKIILIRSLFTVLFCLSAVMLFGQQIIQNNRGQNRQHKLENNILVRK